MADEDSFATEQDMNDRSLGEITTTSHPFLEKELEAATQSIRDECGWHIAPVQTLRFRRRFPEREQVWLPAMEIISVGPATIDGKIFEGEIEFDPRTGWTNLVGRNVDVSYIAGFENIPADLVTLTLEIAAAGLGTSLGFARQQAGSVSVTFDRVGGGVGDNLHRLTRYTIGALP